METPRELWSIGIYGGESPVKLAPHPGVSAPVLSRDDVTDVQADFLADPFMVKKDGRWAMFFEVLPVQGRKGEIGLAWSDDALHWKYAQIVLREPFHLSYPYVFEWEGDHYMIPETLGAGFIRLYKATPFPTAWSPQADLIPGRFADPSIVRWDDRWWIFACPTPDTHDTLCLYFADSLIGPWREHPESPIVTGDPARARPGGRVTVWGDRLLRYAQVCAPSYGLAVRAFEITKLTPSAYREEEASPQHILSPGDGGWNRAGMHHVDAHLLPDGRWIACVDGRGIACDRHGDRVANRLMGKDGGG